MTARPPPRPRAFLSAMHALAALREPACLLDHGGIILFVNDAWERFGAANGAGERCGAAALVGTRWLDAIAGEVPRALHATLLHRALRGAGQGPGGAVVHTSECNDAHTARLVTARLAPVQVSAGSPGGVSVVHRVVRELRVEDVYAPVDAAAERYRDAGGAIRQCGCCRRTSRPDAGEEWDFVPGLVAAPPRGVEFGYCPLCVALHGAGSPDPVPSR